MYFRNLMQTDPWREMERIQGEMNRLFNRVPDRSWQPYPAVNIWTHNDEAMITAELPGYNAKDINLTIVNDELYLKGKRDADKFSEKDQLHRQERQVGAFERTIQLPFMVEADKIEARFSGGILTVKMPRAEADKPKKIAIKTK